jgi:hypothetical protein
MMQSTVSHSLFPACLQRPSAVRGTRGIRHGIFSHEYGKQLRNALGVDADIVNDLARNCRVWRPPLGSTNRGLSMKLFPKHQRLASFEASRNAGPRVSCRSCSFLIPSFCKMHRCTGKFLLVQLENEEKQFLGRMTSKRQKANLVGESANAIRFEQCPEERPVPDQLREIFLGTGLIFEYLRAQTEGPNATYADPQPATPQRWKPIAFPQTNFERE